MKKIILSAVILLIAVSSLNAQELSEVNTVRFGVKAGFGYGRLMTPTKQGFSYEIMLSLDDRISPNNPLVYIGGGIGFRYFDHNNDSVFESKVSFSHINADLYIGRDRLAGSFGIRGGLRSTFLVNAKVDNSQGGKENIKDHCHLIQGGLILSPYFSFGKLEAGLDLSFMLTNFWKKDAGYSSGSQYLSGGVFVGVKF